MAKHRADHQNHDLPHTPTPQPPHTTTYGTPEGHKITQTPVPDNPNTMTLWTTTINGTPITRSTTHQLETARALAINLARILDRLTPQTRATVIAELTN